MVDVYIGKPPSFFVCQLHDFCQSDYLSMIWFGVQVNSGPILCRVETTVSLVLVFVSMRWWSGLCSLIVDFVQDFCSRLSSSKVSCSGLYLTHG